MNIRLGLFFKDFACWLMNTSSVGLNVAGYTTAAVLKKHGIKTAVFPVRHNVDIVHAIDKYNETNQHPLTHAVISAPWLSVFDLEALLKNFPRIQFVVQVHSNVGFLQADAGGVNLLRHYQRLERQYTNFRISGNSKRFVNWMSTAYNHEILWLPNLYPIHNAHLTKQWDGSLPLKIGAFGVVRPYKNFMTAAAAALVIQQWLQVPVEFHMSSFGEGGGHGIMEAIDAMLRNTGVKVVRHQWAYWNNFIKIIESMDLLIQVSYTESFNLITADGVLSGVPSVVSSVIEWAPKSWVADADDAVSVASKGIKLLDAEPSDIGLCAIEKSNKIGLKEWKNFLGLEKHHWYDNWCW